MFWEKFSNWFINERSAGDKLWSIFMWIITDGAWIVVTLCHYLYISKRRRK